MATRRDIIKRIGLLACLPLGFCFPKKQRSKYGLIIAGRHDANAEIRVWLNGQEVHKRSSKVNEIEGWVEMFDIEPCVNADGSLLTRISRKHYGEVIVTVNGKLA